MSDNVQVDVAVLGERLEHVCKSIDEQTEAYKESNGYLREIAANLDKRMALIEEDSMVKEKKIKHTQSRVDTNCLEINTLKRTEAVNKIKTPALSVAGGVVGASLVTGKFPAAYSFIMKFFGF